MVDGNQLCDLGHITPIVLFYRGLTVVVQSTQSLNIENLPDSVPHSVRQFLAARSVIRGLLLALYLTRPYLSESPMAHFTRRVAVHHIRAHVRKRIA